MKRPQEAAVFVVMVCCLAPSTRAAKPPLTLDDFFNSVELSAVEISPDGGSVAIETTRPEWEANRFRTDLWLYREAEGGQGGRLVQLTRSGHDSDPQWSPDGEWIAFLSDRPASTSQGKGRDGGDDDDKDFSQVYVISLRGGEAFPVTFGDEDVHAFAWSADSRLIFFATREPWSKEQKDANKKEWNDVNRYRQAERGDTLFRVEVAKAGMAGAGSGAAAPAEKPPNTGQETQPVTLASTPYRVLQMSCSPDGARLAVASESPSERGESREPYGIYLLDLPAPPHATLRLALHSLDAVNEVHWSRDSRRIIFAYNSGTPEGPYEDPQRRLYSVDAGAPERADSNEPTRSVRWAGHFEGSVNGFTVTSEGGVALAGMLGTEVQPYLQSSATGETVRQPGWGGTYGKLSAASHSTHVAFVFSSLQKPPEVYLAEGFDRLEQARSITTFNQFLAVRELPQGKPYRWRTDDGATAEGMLIYPPGRFGAPGLPMFTFVHGGPEDADGNRFEADWYQWSALAATAGRLVFEPNYRGSVGYGDRWALGVIPHIVSRPGKDILEGVDALVKDGIADPGHLTIGGYSYGGYLTNWLITQTNRFQAAVTGAGAVEHAANWGNDDSPYDDAYFLGGLPWEAKANYDAEAALWQMGKVTTPTHIAAGEDDIRVYVGEDYLLERALYTRHIPTHLLIFPGEGHGLGKNPWHGKIKVREELKWLARYGGAGSASQ